MAAPTTTYDRYRRAGKEKLSVTDGDGEFEKLLILDECVDGGSTLLTCAHSQDDGSSAGDSVAAGEDALKGCLIVNENEMTTREGVFAGGDAVTGAATVILAMGAGKKGAAAIDAFIKNQ